MVEAKAFLQRIETGAEAELESALTHIKNLIAHVEASAETESKDVLSDVASEATKAEAKV